MKILIVEDNRHLAQNVETYLLEEGNVCAIAFTYHEAVEKVVSLGYDIVTRIKAVYRRKNLAATPRSAARSSPCIPRPAP